MQRIPILESGQLDFAGCPVAYPARMKSQTCSVLRVSLYYIPETYTLHKFTYISIVEVTSRKMQVINLALNSY